MDQLYVKAATADKSFTLKRFHSRGRGRAGKIMKPRTHLCITVAERAPEAPKAPKVLKGKKATQAATQAAKQPVQPTTAATEVSA